MIPAWTLLLALIPAGIFLALWLNARARLMSALPGLSTAQSSSQADQPAALLTLPDAAYNALLLADSNHHVLAMNNAALSLFGASVRSGAQSIMAVTRAHEIDDLVGAALAGRTDVDAVQEISIQGRLYRVRAVVSADGSGRYVAIALDDVSELQRLGRARRDMVANVSHELRTPVTSIRLLVDTLLRGKAIAASKQRQLLEKIAAENDVIQQLAQELLDLSMIESGRMEMILVPVDLHEIITNAIERLSEQAARKSISMVDNVPEKISVLVDADQVGRVMVNLMHNAIKFSPEGGRLVVEALSDGDLATVMVTDSGPGIDPEERERIFERFYRSDRARGRGGGTGLGLAIAKHIVMAHGGSIHAEGSPQPPGARIVFTLPVA